MDKKSIFKLQLVLLVFVLLLLTVSCTGIRRGKDTDEYYRRGSQGLELRFAKNSPPSNLFDNDDFRVSLEIYNKGATTVSGGNNMVYLSGFDTGLISGVTGPGPSYQDYFTGLIEDLEGKAPSNPEGDYDIIEFGGYIRDLASRNIDIYEPTILATACYSYETVASPTVCIDSDPYSTTDAEKVCTPASVSPGTQGAPVAVTKIDVEPRPGATQFKIYVQNVGGGTVFRDGYSYLSMCNPYGTDRLNSVSDIDYVYVESVSIGTTAITSSCKPLDRESNLRLSGSASRKSGATGFMTCELTGITGPAYRSPLIIVLKYGYRNSISKKVKILQTPT